MTPASRDIPLLSSRFTFYVNKLFGNDGNDGRSPASAKQTLAGVLALGALKSGASVGLCANSVWQENFVVPYPNMRLGAYGVGQAPVISGAATLGPWTFEAAVSTAVVGPTNPNVTISGAFAGVAAPNTPPTRWTISNPNNLTWSLATDDTEISGQRVLLLTIANPHASEFQFDLVSAPVVVTASAQHVFSVFASLVSGDPLAGGGYFNLESLTAPFPGGTFTGLTGTLTRYTISHVPGSAADQYRIRCSLKPGASGVIKIALARLERGSSSTVTQTGIHTPRCWHAAQATDPGVQVFFDNERLFPAASKSAGVSGKSWFDDRNGRLYVFDDPAEHVVEAAARNYCIEVNAKTNIRISGIEVEKPILDGIYGHGGVGGLTIVGGSGRLAGRNNVRVGDGGVDGAASTANPDVIVSGFASSLSGGTGMQGFNQVHRIMFVGCTSTRDVQSDLAENFTAGIRIVSNYVAATQATNNRPDAVAIRNCSAFNTGRNGAGTIIVTGERGYAFWLDTPGPGSWIEGCSAANSAKYHYHYEWGSAFSSPQPCLGGVRDCAFSGLAEGGVLLSRRCNGAQVHDVVGTGPGTNSGTGIRVQGAAGDTNSMTANLVYNCRVSGFLRQFSAVKGGDNITLGSGNEYFANDFGPEGVHFLEWVEGADYSSYAAVVTASSGAFHDNAG